ncbi:MAG: hypothetical protein AAB347_14135 [Bacteroidota bacterium]
MSVNTKILYIPEPETKRIVIIGVKNKLFILLDWTWKYITYDQALRLLIKHKAKY